MKTATVVLAALIASAAALPAAASVTAKADSAARSTVAQEGTTGSAQPKLICRRQQTTESRIGGERLCLTKEQWRIVNSGGEVVIQQPKRAR